MKYKVLVSFTDKGDVQADKGKNVYWKGDVYPRDGYTPSKERVTCLTGGNNALKQPVIVPLEEKQP